jgi:hypothetical protein
MEVYEEKMCVSSGFWQQNIERLLLFWEIGNVTSGFLTNRLIILVIYPWRRTFSGEFKTTISSALNISTEIEDIMIRSSKTIYYYFMIFV